ncbi:MAG: pyridoxal phosphate-dependent aminotransferase [Clostridiales bacterium]|nr:pyridoxal phosphate-dependent aminotransferase [Clostridiales bacterium]MBS5877167.1 pyridoxal phosphate-dependent aminotransferase [Clostridiales bacterium]
MIAGGIREQVEKSSVIRQMFEEGNRLAAIYGRENVFDFSLGNPNLPAPESVKDAIKNILDTRDSVQIHGYMSNAGYPEVRKTIADSLNRRFGTHFDETNICMTVGAAGGMNTILKSIIDRDDEVVAIAPFFGEYRGYVENYGGKLVVAAPNPPEFRLDVDKLAEVITSKTKAVIVNNPNNPSGVVYTEDDIKNLVKAIELKKSEYNTDIAIISDEPYRELVYDGRGVPFLTKYYKDTFICYSYSKSLSLPGERIGYIVIPDEMTESEELKSALSVATRILGFVNAPSLLQLTVAANVDAEVNVAAYDKNRKALYSGLTGLGFECVRPDGAFYLFVKSPISDEKTFCDLAKEQNILLVPGSAFGCPGYVRIAYCVSYETIVNSMQGFARLAESLGLSVDK